MFICIHLWLSLPASAQDFGEVVANLSTGRVVICVAKDGIAVGAVEVKGEAESRPPAVVQLSRFRVAILLGAAEWTDASGAPPVLLGQELPRLVGEASGGGPRLQQEKLSDIEAIGLGLLEAIRPHTIKIHRKLDLAEDEPLVELLLVGYVENYGPEVWSLQYRVVQDPLRGDFYRTRILRPRYNQLYPPEKGQPKTLIEVSYPESRGPSIAERLKSDPALAPLRSGGDPTVAEASAHIESGQSDKAKLEPAAQWLRGVLNGTAPNATQIFAIIRAEGGFDWVLAPPRVPERAEDSKQRDPNAPTLKKP